VTAAVAPEPWPHDPLPELSRLAAERPVVVLDDDPTGTQTLRDVTVLTGWDPATIREHLGEGVLFLSTNSRSLDDGAAVELVARAARDIRTAAGDRAVSIVSRGDSTLRGHFPAEVLAVATDMPEARVLLAPYFGDGGRVTVDDVHLLDRDGTRQPVAETEFARDATFGFRSSNLREWVAEKYARANLPAPPTVSLSLDLVRRGGPPGVASALAALAPGSVAVANAVVDRDIEVVALGALRAEVGGLPLVARTAASYVRARAGRAPAPPLAASEIGGGPAGLVVVGSHVPTTTGQLGRLRDALPEDRLSAVELPVDALLDDDRAARTIDAAIDTLDEAIRAGRIALVATERVPREIGLEGARRVSAALVRVVEGLRARPDWVVAKGGITSSDVASRALSMRAARVAGQLLPGVPVWVGDADTRWPGVPLVVFPGNVGSRDTLTEVVRSLTAA
jgi:uncharacterized protein YgbK (DUF1537 family)